MTTGETGARRTLDRKHRTKGVLMDHFRPTSKLFPPAWKARVAMSTMGIIATLSCVALGGGMYCCIQQKSKALGGRPSSTAWIASLIICIIGGPLCMWIPFIIDSCYDRRPAQTAVIIQQAPQNFVMAQQPVMAQAQAQPVMAQAQPAMMAQSQPVMAQAQPVMAQAQPMSKTQTQGP